MPLAHSDAIEVRRVAGKGRGVFARRAIREGDVIERVPVLVLPEEVVEGLSGEPAHWQYFFEWGRGTVALALGYGSLYNHSFRPNARYRDESRRTKVFFALREILPGEEITVNYNGDPRDQSPVDFDVIEARQSNQRAVRDPGGVQRRGRFEGLAARRRKLAAGVLQGR
jgi:SET domain-containing protein